MNLLLNIVRIIFRYLSDYLQNPHLYPVDIQKKSLTQQFPAFGHSVIRGWVAYNSIVRCKPYSPKTWISASLATCSIGYTKSSLNFDCLCFHCFYAKTT